MKLSRLYSDQPALFVPIDFREGLNVILANIQRPKDPSALGHNLGKSLLIDIIDFGLLKEVKKEHFFKSRSDLFASFVFFLEIQLPSGGYLTIRRSAAEPTKIAFKHHPLRHQDFTLLPQEQWDHWRESFDNAVKLLDSYLAFTPIKPWSYRKGVSYFLRTQQDYFDVFKLAKFVGTNKQWKPYLARVLGFDDQLLSAKYEADADCEKHTAEQKELQAELTLKSSDFEKLRASIALKRDEVAGKLRCLDAFDFLGQETAMARELAESIETEIASNNEIIYNVRHDLAQIERSLGDEIHFDLADVQRVFQEAQITFPTQLARDYEDLVEFNRRILTERRASLSEHAARLRKQLVSTEEANTALSAKRRDILQVLGGTDSLQKFKDLQRQLDQDRANLAIMELKASKLEGLRAVSEKLREAKAEAERHTIALKQMLHAGNARFAGIQLTFGRIIREVLHCTALLYLKPNGEGNLDFRAEITEMDQATEQDRGTSFRQMLCIAFDLAVLISYAREPFFHFVYHDGGLERLQSKLKLALLQVIRDTCRDHGIQYLLSVLSEDIAIAEDTAGLCPKPEEIVLTLHDGGESGRLFRMGTF